MMYVTLVDVNESAFQNVQELASVWGDIRTELTEVGVDLYDAYTLLGGYDFVVLFEAPDRETAFQASVTLERHGLDTETMGAFPVEDLGGLVEEV